VAQQVREILAALGVRRLSDVIGRADLLERLERPDVPRAQMLDLSLLLAPAPGWSEHPQLPTQSRNDRPGVVYLDDEILAECDGHIAHDLPFSGFYDIQNHHLTVGGRVAGAVARRYGDAGLPRAHLNLRFRGSAGQSFGAFAITGMRLELEGEANDYAGKGLSGGEISIRPFRQAGYGGATHENTIVGNTCLYGATGGRYFAAGQAASRFAVRNSGAVAVIEGAGNHCCEYMTGGLVLVLGPVGRNFGAGMSNGIAYVMDEGDTLRPRVNQDMVQVEECSPEDEAIILALIHEHQERTGSPRARQIMSAWEQFRPSFQKIVPRSISIVPQELLTAKGARERAEVEAVPSRSSG
jgi:glutamate synthase domain-containing protein 3